MIVLDFDETTRRDIEVRAEKLERLKEILQEDERILITFPGGLEGYRTGS